MQFRFLVKALFLAACAIGCAAVQAQEVIYYHTDALGSVVAVSDANRNVLERNEYEPYGKVVNHPLRDGPGYTGHVADAQTGLIYMQARYYDDDLGEFPTVDPVSAYSVGGTFHRYWYANNNPYRFTDPDGRQAADKWSDTVATVHKEGRQEELKVFEKPAAYTLTALIAATPVIGPGLAFGFRTMAKSPTEQSTAAPAQVTVSASRHPESAAHIRDAQAAGQPAVLTINRAGAAENRRAALEGTPRQAGRDRDEYPPAMFSEGGQGASVRAISPGDNRGAGACIGAQCRGLPDGTRVLFKVE